MDVLVDVIRQRFDMAVAERHLPNSTMRASIALAPVDARFVLERCLSSIAEIVIIETGTPGFVIVAALTGIIMGRIEVLLSDHVGRRRTVGDMRDLNDAAVRS